MLQIVLSFIGGLLVGILFKFIKLPVPAPPLIGIVGVIGIFLGAELVKAIFQLF
ncbi:XapX domain-containing protein [Lysinibacillus sp. NPDC097195]|uniref:XapX domain-containing protein n=1 Tax=Lysinibacillus sp. NPDC097195 TaxID=3364141 RepID=UPI003823C25D